MISRFLFFTFIFALIGGFFIHFQVDIPWLMGWVGKLPGDLFVKKDDLIVYVPITSAALASLMLTVIFSVFSRR